MFNSPSFLHTQQQGLGKDSCTTTLLITYLKMCCYGCTGYGSEVFLHVHIQLLVL